MNIWEFSYVTEPASSLSWRKEENDVTMVTMAEAKRVRSYSGTHREDRIHGGVSG